MLCSGKVYYDIDGHDRREQADSVAIARVELLYPFARDQLAELIAGYPNLKQIVWAQEEPKNMGAWSVMWRRLPELIPEGVELCLRRPPPARQPQRGLPGRAPLRAGADRADGADLGQGRNGTR